jgi:hypothetical protein
LLNVVARVPLVGIGNDRREGHVEGESRIRDLRVGHTGDRLFEIDGAKEEKLLE